MSAGMGKQHLLSDRPLATNRKRDFPAAGAVAFPAESSRSRFLRLLETCASRSSKNSKTVPKFVPGARIS
jgi:hypothetical protein